MNAHHRGRTLTLSRIYANCANKGDCKVWKGGMNNKGYPNVYDPSYIRTGRAGGGTKAGRVLVWTIKHGEKPAGKVVMTCGDRLCLAHQHMTLMTSKEVGAVASANGSFDGTRARVARLANLQRAQTLSHEKAKALRERLSEGEDPNTVAAAFGVSRRHALDVGKGKCWQERRMFGSSVFNFVPELAA